MNTISTRNLVIDNKCFGDGALLVEIAPYYAYVDGVKGGIEGYKYAVVLPKCSFSRLEVKIKGDPQLTLDPGETVPVVFEELLVRPYAYMSGSRALLGITAQASAIRKVGNK